MIYGLIIILIFLLVIAYFFNNKDITSPSIIFTLSFIFASFWATIYADFWNLNDMYENTFFVIFGGVLEFIVVSFVVQQLFLRGKGYKYKDEKVEIKKINVDILIEFICLFFEIIICLLYIKFILETTNGSFSSLKKSISEFDQLVKFSDQIIKPPKFVGVSLTLISIMSYWYMYIIINNFVAKKEIDVLSISIVLVAIVIGLLSGGRNGAINLILSTIPVFYILLKKKGSFRKKIHLKLWMKIGLIAGPVFVLVAFPKIASILGRKTNYSTSYYLAIYCGAEIKNLDTYLIERDFTPNYTNASSNNQTFNVLINWLGPKLGLLDKEYKLDLPFRKVNDDYGLGNVYTTFYPYIYDYGYKGVLFCVALMAFLSQFIYEKAKRAKSNNVPNIWILSYGYMFSSLALSFFSNKFYEQNFGRGLILGILCWCLFNYFLTKVKTKKRMFNIKEIEEI